MVRIESPVFSLQALLATLSDPVSLGIIGSLIILEGLLSADNAFVLAVLVRGLAKKHRQLGRKNKNFKS